MNKYFAYIRVSTTRQGEHGVSLQQQRQAIEKHAAKNALEVCRWFEEQETAAKRGRPQFTQMLKMLQRRKAAGVIIHKIDRSARNLKDWAELGELIDAGVMVHFANESLDLTSRGGRLSADLQAVVAADFIRNLREETKKGFYGRLKQGLLPMPAPLGYLDTAPGKPKVPDPARAPLARLAFEMYATGKYNQVELGDELYRLGLRSSSGRRVDKNFLGRMLRNPFYMGLIHVRKTNESYLGVHKPLVSKTLFEQVQQVLDGNFCGIKSRHDFLFRRLFWCKLCGRLLIGESHKGHTYYRCQGKFCPTTSIREEIIENAVIERLRMIQLDPQDHDYLKTKIDGFQNHWTENKQKVIGSWKLELAQAKDRLDKLTDAYLDGIMERDLFEEKKTALLMERRGLEDRIEQLANQNMSLVSPALTRLLELTGAAYSLYVDGVPEEKRELIRDVSSNRTLHEKTIDISLSVPFDEIAKCRQITTGSPSRANARTWDRLADYIFYFARRMTGAQDVKRRIGLLNK